MTSNPSPRAGAATAHGPIVRLVRGAAHAAQRRPKTIIAAWLLFVIACVAGGSMAGTRSLTGTQSEVGQSATADTLLTRADLRDPAVENVLVRSHSVASTTSATTDLAARAGALPAVASVVTPRQSHALLAEDGREALVQVTLRGDPDHAGDNVGQLVDAVAAVAKSHPGVRLQEAGEGTENNAINGLIQTDLHHAELISLPITLVILVAAFGALVAASVPLILGLTAVAAATGAMGLVSHIAPAGGSTSAVVVLIGLAVGVDYSLFYIRREREERRRGHGAPRRKGAVSSVPGMPDSALDAAAASVGRAILVSGLTVMVALAGLLITGARDFISMGLGTILVVGIAAIGSLTVLPAVLALLGDRVDRGRVPGYRALARRRELRERREGAGRPVGFWAHVSSAVTTSPIAALVAAVCVLGTLAVPLFGMHTADLQVSDLPQNLPVVQAVNAMEASFPGAPDSAQLVVVGHDLGSAGAREGLQRLGTRALHVTGGRGATPVDVSGDGTLARIDVPLPQRGLADEKAIVSRLRNGLAATATRIPHVTTPALVAGAAASSLDYSHRMAVRTPIVIAFVLALGFLLLLLTFRAPLLAAAVMGLSLLSIGAAYGVLVAVFQHTWADGLLGFHSSGNIIDWMPLFMFVVLFGLSMDYTVLVLERIREARSRGLSPREAAAEGVGATAGTVTSAAIVMVAVFSIFATLGVIDFKQLGVGLAVAVLIDATIVRGVALPAVVTLLGERGWRVPRSSVAVARECEDAPVATDEEVPA